MADVLDLPVRALFADDAATPASPADADGMLREAVFALAARELAGLVRALPLERAAAALRDRDPVAAVGGLLADAALAHTAASADDPLSVALLHGARRRRELLAQAGGAWTAGRTADHLGITRQGVDKRRQTGTLLGVRLPGGDWVYPVAQFAPDGAPLPGLADVLGALRGVTSHWMRLEHLLAPDPMLSVRAVRSTRDGGEDASALSDAPRSALQALRDDGRAALPAIVRALRQAGDADE